MSLKSTHYNFSYDVPLTCFNVSLLNIPSFSKVVDQKHQFSHQYYDVDVSKQSISDLVQKPLSPISVHLSVIDMIHKTSRALCINVHLSAADDITQLLTTRKISIPSIWSRVIFKRAITGFKANLCIILGVSTDVYILRQSWRESLCILINQDRSFGGDLVAMIMPVPRWYWNNISLRLIS